MGLAGRLHIKEGRYRDRRQDIQIWQGITLKAGANTYRTTYGLK